MLGVTGSVEYLINFRYVYKVPIKLFGLNTFIMIKLCCKNIEDVRKSHGKYTWARLKLNISRIFLGRYLAPNTEISILHSCTVTPNNYITQPSSEKTLEIAKHFLSGYTVEAMPIFAHRTIIIELYVCTYIWKVDSNLMQ